MPNQTADSSEPTATTRDRARRRTIGRVVIGLVVLAGLLVLGRQAGAQAVPHVLRFVAWVDGLGWWGPIVFIAGYAVATVAFIPGSALTLAAGVIFGLAAGVCYVFIGAVIGSCGAFLIARHWARAAVERRLAGNERFAAIDRAIGTEGRKIVVLLRLSPLFPFNFLNYGLGLTKVRFVDYAVASFGMLPGSLLYVYYGKLLGDVAAVAGGAQERPGYYAFLAVGFVVTIAVTTIVTRTARRALAAAPETSAGA